MHALARAATALALLATSCTTLSALASEMVAQQPDGLRALNGQWLYVEDRTEGRPIEQHQPSMSARFSLRIEEGAVVLVRGQGAATREVRMPLDRSTTEVAGPQSISRYRGGWKDVSFEYETELLRVSDKSRVGLIQTQMRHTPEGLLVRVAVDPPTGLKSVALYRHPQDIPLRTPARATMGDVAWLSGAWVGTRGAASIEERWTPPLGGAMLGVSRTVSRDRLVAFEFLRVVEREGGLVYIAQPNGAPPTEFVLTELAGKRAVFENPRHDFPQRISYELSPEGQLSASISRIKGGRQQRFDFKREGS